MLQPQVNQNVREEFPWFIRLLSLEYWSSWPWQAIGAESISLDLPVQILLTPSCLPPTISDVKISGQPPHVFKRILIFITNAPPQTIYLHFIRFCALASLVASIYWWQSSSVLFFVPTLHVDLSVSLVICMLTKPEEKFKQRAFPVIYCVSCITRIPTKAGNRNRACLCLKV